MVGGDPLVGEVDDGVTDDEGDDKEESKYDDGLLCKVPHDKKGGGFRRRCRGQRDLSHP